MEESEVSVLQKTKPVPPVVQERLHEIMSMTPGARFELLSELAVKGFVITVTLRLHENGQVCESILFETKEEAAQREGALRP